MAALIAPDIDRLIAAGRAAVERVKFYLPDTPFVIAGGYFRDTLMQGPIMDVDVFTLPPQGWTQDRAHMNLNEEYGDLAGQVETIGTIRIGDDEVDIQRILLNPERYPELTNETVCDRVDIGLCRISMDHNGRLHLSEAAQNDYEGRVLTVLRTNGKDSTRVRARLEKIQDRYPYAGFVQDDPLGLLEPEEDILFDD